MLCFCRTFRIFDDDGNRSLDFSEFKKGLQDYGMNMELAEMKQVFAELDKDGGGSLDFDEFLIALRVRYCIKIFYSNC